MEDLFLGIDIGTTAIKFGVIAAGEFIYQQALPIQTFYGDHGAKYQSARELLTQIKLGIQKIPANLRAAIKLLSFSAPMHSCRPIVPGQVNDRIYIWSDTQAQQTIAAYQQTTQAQEVYLKTGTPIHPMSPFAKIKHFKDQDQYSIATKWYGIKELVLQTFTGVARIDLATASATGLLNIHSLQWDQEILTDLGIDEQALAELVATTAEFAIVPELATELNLAQDVTVVAGASDGCLAALAGFKTTGIANSLTIGTSAAVRKVSAKIELDPARQNFCYYLQPDHYIIGAPSNNGGNVIAWASQQFAQDATEFHAELPAILRASSVGANGVRFMPFLNGERAPYWDADKKASFQNIRADHTRADLIRSVIEGMLLNIHQLTDLVGVQAQISISGGVFHSPVLQQLTADILGLDCWLSAANEPIAGLYILITGQQLRTTTRLTAIKFDVQTHQRYQQIYQDYFE
ncbi:gluconokinase [Lapidilactobacillus bayanensis]|uniref:gluconokinase n=1 Tax=Lapidilactobacillus bayanensis TaxID=2485998 RepID=UPI000F7ADD7B|nr:FGGY family carbohydrate kinase [Lapidilactobacillus bayanensis]